MHTTVKLPENIKPHLDIIHKNILQSIPDDFPVSLSEPIRYFLQMPGKMIRPLLTLFSSKAVGGNMEDALPAAIAVELFHDFTLIHDDIMDQDDLRRGLETLHVKYGDSTAILSGDALIGLAYSQLMRVPDTSLNAVTKIFTEALVKVCEGQALDKEFEARDDIQLEEYLDMIAKKTAWLIKTACALGAHCGNGTPEQVDLLTSFGYNLGMGFQIQDDLLDFVADENKLGKKVGSDFRMHKTTYVTLKYRRILQSSAQYRSNYPADISKYSSFAEFQQALDELSVIPSGQQEADHYIQLAIADLAQVIPLESGNPLYEITRFLQRRQY